MTDQKSPGVAGAFSLLFADRLLLGAATAAVMASGTALISAFYTGHARLVMIARQGMIIELGGVIFLAVGGELASLGWRWPFALYLTAWLMLGLVRAFVPRPAQSATIADDDGAADSDISPTLGVVYAAALIAMTVFFVAVVTLPIRLHGLGYSEPEIGYFLSFISLVAVGAAFVMPWVARSLGGYATLTMAFALFCAAHLMLARVGTTPALIVAAIVMGTGFGFSVPLVNHMTVELSDPAVRGRNLSYLSMALFLGQFLASFSDFAPGRSTNAFVIAAAMGLVAAVTLAAVTALARMRRRLGE